MKALDETSKFLEAGAAQSAEKEAQSTTDLLTSVKEVFSTLTSAVRDLERVMTALQVKDTDTETNTNTEEVE